MVPTAVVVVALWLAESALGQEVLSSIPASFILFKRTCRSELCLVSAPSVKDG